MNGLQVLLAIGLGLIVNEFTNVSPWLARKIAMWSAQLRYIDSRRAQVRAEEWAALINDRPGNLFKLITSLRFASAAVVTRIRRLVAGVPIGEDDSSEELLSLSTPAQYQQVSALVARYLFPTEKFRGEWRRHWIHPAKGIGVIAVYASLGIWAATLRLDPRYQPIVVSGIVVATMTLVVHRILAWRFTRFVITNKRIMATEGLLFRRVAMIPLLRVTDLRYEQSPVARLLSYGTFRLESASRRNAMRKIVDLPNPNELYLRVVEEMYEPEAVERRIQSYGDEIFEDIAEENGAEAVDTDDIDSAHQPHPPHQPRSSRLPTTSVDYDALAEQIAEVSTQLGRLAASVKELAPILATNTPSNDAALAADDTSIVMSDPTRSSIRHTVLPTTHDAARNASGIDANASHEEDFQ